MAFVEVAPNSIKLDAEPQQGGGFVEVDPNTIKLDKPEVGTAYDTYMSAMGGLLHGVPKMLDLGGALVATPLIKQKGESLGSAFTRAQETAPINKAVNVLDKGQYEPQTYTGKMAEMGGEFVSTLPFGGVKALTAANVGKAASMGAGSVVGGDTGKYVGQFVGGDTGGQVGEAVGNVAGAMLALPTIRGVVKVGGKISGGGSSFMKGLKNPETTAAKQTPAKTSQDFKDLASASYKAADEAGGVLTPDVTNGFIAKAKEVLPQTEAGKLVAGSSEVSDLVGRIGGLSDQTLSLKAAQEIDEHLGDIGYSLTDARGNLTKQGINVLKLQSALRDSISAATEADVIGGRAGFDALKQARGYWSKAMQLGDLERIATRAESMDNPLLAVRTGLRQIINNPKRMRQFAPDVQAAIREAAKSGFAGDMLRIASSKLLPIGAAAVGHIPGAVLGEAANLAGKGAQAALGARRLENIAQMVSNGGQSAPGYLERLGASTGRGISALSDGIQNIIGHERAQKIMQLVGSGVKGENLVQGVKEIAGDSADDVANVLRNSGDGELKATFDKFGSSAPYTQEDLNSISQGINEYQDKVNYGHSLLKEGYNTSLRDEVKKVVQEANDIKSAFSKSKVGNSLSTWIMKEFGGVNASGLSNKDFGGTLPFVVRKGAKVDISTVAEEAWKKGYISSPDEQTLITALKSGSKYMPEDAASRSIASNYFEEAAKQFEDKYGVSINASKEDIVRSVQNNLEKKHGIKLSARPEATAAALGLAGINGANFLSSTLTNTSYNPATPSQVPNGDMRTMGVPIQKQTVQPQEQNTQPTFADKVFQAESKGNPNAKSKTSSAYGAAQFTRGTWLNMVKKYDPITFNSMSKADVLGLRADTDYAKKMTNSLASENADHLAGKNVPVNDVSLYLSHFAGPSVTAKVMRARPSAPLSLFFTRDAINANPSVLRGKTVSDLIQWAERKMS